MKDENKKYITMKDILMAIEHLELEAKESKEENGFHDFETC